MTTKQLATEMLKKAQLLFPKNSVCSVKVYTETWSYNKKPIIRCVLIGVPFSPSDFDIESISIEGNSIKEIFDKVNGKIDAFQNSSHLDIE